MSAPLVILTSILGSYAWTWTNFFVPQTSGLLAVIKTYIISGSLLSIYLFFISSTRVSKIFGYLVFLVFPVAVLLFSAINNLFYLMFLYELFVLPSIVVVYFFSPNIRFLAANLYFVMWTQVGSVCVVIGLILVYLYHGSLYFSDIEHGLSFYASLLFLVGFGIKVPTWPFHFWLTKTHVEAPTFFSIYLSGFLVKTAVLGLIALTPYLDPTALQLFIVISVVGIIDSTFKLISQVDLKKIVAYTTVQEMNMILLIVFISGSKGLFYVNMFILTHTILSTLFFYIVDIIYKQRSARTTNAVYGLGAENYYFGALVLVSVFFYLGLPLTVKFFVELKLFSMLYSYSFSLLLVVLFGVNWIGAAFFGKVWFNVVYSVPSSKGHANLKKKEVIFLSVHLIIFLVLPLILVAL